MARSFLGLFLVALAPAALAGCGVSFDWNGAAEPGSGRIERQSRIVKEFDRIEIGGAYDVTVTVGGSPSVSLIGDDNLLPLVRTEVRNGTLHVESVRDIDPSEDVEIEISTGSLEAISSSGSSEVSVSGIRAASLSASVSGSSEMSASGTADRIDAHVSGSGELDLYGVRARAADVQVSGSGEVRIFATERLDASVSGSGDVLYEGTPEVSRSVSGSGSVRPG